MRLLKVNCIILACLATTLVADETRPKRDLQFWKDLLIAKLGLAPKAPQKEESVKIFRIPGFEQVLVKAVPKVTVVETPVPERIPIRVDPTIATLESYLGTRTPEETMLALQGMKQLIQSGVLTARQDFIELTPQKQPVYVLSSPPIAPQRLDVLEPKPVYSVFEKTVVPMPSPVIRPIQPMPMLVPQLPPMPPVPVLPPVPIFQRIPVLPPFPVLPPPPARLIPMPPPNIVVPEIKPLPLPPPMTPVVPIEPLVPTSYSYRQLNADGSMTSYLSEGNQDVVVTETNKPPPPPPSYIFDRFQKIFYGLPLGNPIPVSTGPTFLAPAPVAEVFVGPLPEPVMPMIIEPARVEVKVNQNKNKTFDVFEETRVVKKPHTPTLDQEDSFLPKPFEVDVIEPVSPLVLPPPPVKVESPEIEKGDRFKHIHGTGFISTSYGTYSMKEPSVYFEDISKLPPPPPELLKRIGNVAGKAYDPKSLWGYSVKMSNGVGSYENLSGDKIYYSRLESPSETNVPIFPDPLSSLSDNERKRPSQNIFSAENGDEIDDFGRPFISTKINDESSPGFNSITGNTQDRATVRPDIEPVKKIPALPMPIAGENEKRFYPNAIGAAKYSYTIAGNRGSPDSSKYVFSTETPIRGIGHAMNIDHNRFGSDGFSYTQVNHDGTVDTLTETGKFTTSAITGENIQPMAVDATNILTPSVTIEVGEKQHPGFSYTKIDKEGSVTTFEGDGKVVTGTPILVTEEIRVPARPPIIVGCAHRKPCVPKYIDGKHSSGFSYTQINNEGGVTTYAGDGNIEVPVVAEGPVRPVAIVDVIEPVQKHSPGVTYTQINEAGGIAKLTEHGKIKIPVFPELIKVPARPASIVDIIRPIQKLSSGFSYTQINNAGGATEVTGDGKVVNVVDVPVRPAAFVDVIETFEKPSSGFSYTQINNAGGATEVTGDGKVVKVVDVTVRPAAFVDVIETFEKPSSGFSYTQINKAGGVTKITGDGKVEVPVITEEVKVPVEPTTVVDVVEPFPQPAPAFVEVSEKNPPGTVMFAKPVLSRYVYKQISHTNPQPFTVVKVEDKPRFQVPLGEVKVKVNQHEHVRPDGTRYPCTEVHIIPDDTIVPPLPNGGVTSTVPEGFIYVPPSDADAPRPTLHKVEINNLGSPFSYSEVPSVSTEAPTTTLADADPEEASDEPTSLSLNPIVVAPQGSNYSYTQKNSDGSALNIYSDKDNSVSVNVEDSDTYSELQRGDIPDASS